MSKIKIGKRTFEVKGTLATDTQELRILVDTKTHETIVSYESFGGMDVHYYLASSDALTETALATPKSKKQRKDQGK